MTGDAQAQSRACQASFSLDLLCACTVDALQEALETEWAKLAARREIMLVERHSRALHTRLRDASLAALPSTTGSRVLSMRWGLTSEPLLDSHLLEVTQRPSSWSPILVQTEDFTAQLFLGATTGREKLLFQSSCPADLCTRRPPPQREEFRRSAKTVAQLHDEARRIAAADADVQLPLHWAADDNRPETRMEMMSFLLQHDCKQRQVPQFGSVDTASIDRMATELELRWVRENPIHVFKIGRFDYAMEFRRLLEPEEEHQYTALRSMDLCQWITTEFWDAFNRINGGDWVGGSLVCGQPLDTLPKAIGLLAWRPSRKPLQDLWKKCPPQGFAFPFYFELLEDQQLAENIHDKIAEMASMVREKLGAEKLPWWNPDRLPFVVSGLTKPDSSEMLDSETLRIDLKRNNCALLRYAIFGSDRRHTGNKAGCSAASSANIGAGQDRLHSAGDSLATDSASKRVAAEYEGVHVSYEQMLVKRGPVVDHPSITGRKVRVVQVMSLRGDTLGSALETLKYLRKSMAGKRERTTVRKEYPARSGQRVWEYSREGDGAQNTWVQYAIQWQDRLNAAWLSGEGCDWSLEPHQKAFQRVVRKGTVVKNALVLSLPRQGETVIGFEEPPSTSGIQVNLATCSSVQVRGRRGNFAERLRRLEGMTLVLQRKHIKTLFRRVGMFAMEIASDSLASKRVFLVITAANHKFAECAEAMQLRTKLHVDTHGGKFTFLGGFRPEMFLRGAPLLEFWRESAHRQYPYEWFWQGGNPSDPADCFTSVDRLRMLNDLITTTAQLRVAELQANDVVTRLFPLHDPDTLDHLRMHWAKPWKVVGHSWLRHPFYQDIDSIREYYGVHIAFYFEWLEFYTKWLTAPTAIGVLIYFSKAVMAVDHFQNIVEVEREHDLYPYFALFMALWATLFLEFWKRKSRLLAYQWDIQPHSAVEQVRPKFVAVLRNTFSEDSLMAHLRSIVEPGPTKSPLSRDSLDSDDEIDEDDRGAFSDADLKADLAQHDELVFYPPVKRTMKRLATFPLMLTMIVALVTVLGWVYVGGLQDWVDSQAVDPEKPGSESSEKAQYRSYVVVGIANGIAIPILNVVYKKIAVALTEWELHRTHTAFNEALALKLFMFQFVNSYASLFFIAFWSRSFTRLQFQLFFVMFIGQLVQNFVELGVPALTRWIRSVGGDKPAASTTSDEKASENGLIVGSAGELQMLSESVAKVYDEFALSEDYLEMTIQFGYTTMFVVANPLVPFLALVNNLIEIRVDASKLCYLTQRPQPRSASGIGFWQQILQFMAMLAVVTNFAIISYTKLDTGPEWSECIGSCQDEYDPWGRGETAVEGAALKACIEDCDQAAAAMLENAPTLMDVLLKCDGDDLSDPTDAVGEPAFPCRQMDSIWIAVLLEHLVVLIRFLFGTVMLGSETSKSSTVSCDEFKEAYYHLKSASVATAPRPAAPTTDAATVVAAPSQAKPRARSRGGASDAAVAPHQP